MKNFNKFKIFLVDDDAVFLKFLEIELIQLADFIIETYTSGESCIENLGHNPDVIIMDYHLEGINKNAMNGIETLDKIRALSYQIPVIMLSSSDEMEVISDSLDHRALDYVLKSEVDFLRLKTIIKALLIKKRGERVGWV